MSRRLHAEIDALSEARTHAEFVVSVQKVLRTMAFYIEQSEAAVLEDRESWHDEYADALWHDAAKSTEKAQPRPQKKDRRQPKKPRPQGSEDMRRAEVANAARMRSQADDIPESLRAIMEGKHPSFRQKD